MIIDCIIKYDYTVQLYTVRSMIINYKQYDLIFVLYTDVGSYIVDSGTTSRMIETSPFSRFEVVIEGSLGKYSSSQTSLNLKKMASHVNNKIKLFFF